MIWDRKDEAKASSVSYLLSDEIDVYDVEKYDQYAKIILDEIHNHFYKISKFVRWYMTLIINVGLLGCYMHLFLFNYYPKEKAQKNRY